MLVSYHAPPTSETTGQRYPRYVSRYVIPSGYKGVQADRFRQYMHLLVKSKFILNKAEGFRHLQLSDAAPHVVVGCACCSRRSVA
eukprot:6182722-Pleurochrysis_carterae.AAC.4